MLASARAAGVDVAYRAHDRDRLADLDGVDGLTLDGETLVNMFLGEITKWNDPAIAALNPGLDLPDQDIIIAHRSDGSGTTKIFTTYLSDVSEAWANGPGMRSSPIGISGAGTIVWIRSWFRGC